MSYASRQLWWLTAISLAMMAMGLIWAGFGVRLFQGQFVWVKPFKFALSFALFAATLAWAVDRLSVAAQGWWGLRAMVALVIAAFWIEMIYIAVQAAMGQASHFNFGSAFHRNMYSLMALGAVMLVLGTALIGGMVLRDREARFSPDVRLGVGVGFILSTVLTLITAFTLGGNGGHLVGTAPAGAAVIPFFGWSAAVGDLRPAHFLALHAMQAIPLLAWGVQGRAGARGWIALGAAIYAALTMALFAQALMGLPMVRL